MFRLLSLSLVWLLFKIISFTDVCNKKNLNLMKIDTFVTVNDQEMDQGKNTDKEKRRMIDT